MEYKIILILIVILLGTLGPIQTGVNSTLSNYLSHPSQAAFISFLGGVIIFSIILVFLKPSIPNIVDLKKAPIWSFSGGLMGACIVFGAILIAPKIIAKKPKIFAVSKTFADFPAKAAIIAPTMITDEIAFVTDINGVCSEGVTLQTT